MTKYLFEARYTSDGAKGATREDSLGRHTALAYVKCAIFVSALVAVGPAYGGPANCDGKPDCFTPTPDLPQPPDIVQSDVAGNTAVGDLADAGGGGEANTAVGSSALQASGGQEPGGFNTAVGAFAMFTNQTGSGNTAVGYTALRGNSTGYQNTAIGLQSMDGNSTGYWNTASGNNSMISNTTGYNNTATGNNALACNTTGNWNTASGAFALSGGESSTCEATASGNTASGAQALTSNTEGNKNTASGYLALTSNTTGSYNTASGYEALYYNVDGIRNSASGDWGLYSNTHGSDNTASGQAALYSNTVGSNNIGLGANAGYNVTSGSNNIEIGSEGASSDGGTIRIGSSGTQNTAYIAGIENAKVTGAAVYVTASGQLGVLASSERYKTAIAPMGAGTEKLSELRPVSFHLKSDPKGAVQYGLIAEEVATVYPELVIRDAAGKIQGVRYDELAPMLLNEVQKQRRKITAQDEHAAAQATELRNLKKLVVEMQAGLLQLQAKDVIVAQR
jgi:hypothetical protein